MANSGAARAARNDADATSTPPGQSAPPEDRDVEVWRDDGVVPEAKRAVSRGSKRPKQPKNGQAERSKKGRTRRNVEVDPEVVADINRVLDGHRARRAVAAVQEGATAFDRERYRDARKSLKDVAEEAPSVAGVRELYGLTCYRLDQWKAAVVELEAFSSLTNSTDQHPVLADCYRALRQWTEVERVWMELREASPSRDLVTEGRIVMAGALADRGDLAGAIELLEQGIHKIKSRKRLMDHDLRRIYVLGDLYERAGDHPVARQHFSRIRTEDPDFADVGHRLSQLG